MKFDIFFTYFESSLKFFIQIKILAFISITGIYFCIISKNALSGQQKELK